MKSRTTASTKYPRLAIALDVGTTFSGAAYSIIENDQERPDVRSVTRFPGQRIGASEGFKTPSVIVYSKDGEFMAAGSDAISPRMAERIKKEDLIKVEWFKLLLHAQIAQDMSLHNRVQLPPGSTAITIFGDYLKYLLDCVKEFLCDTHLNGSDIWATLLPGAQFIITHPNGWTGWEQSKLRKAAEYAGLIQSADDKQLTFVTEGEASFHYCTKHGLSSSPQRKLTITVIDLGGGTVDLSTFAVSSKSVDEATNARCLAMGSLTVTQRAKAYFEKKLIGASYARAIPLLAAAFDKDLKITFDDSCETYRIRPDRHLCDSLSRGIVDGALVVPHEVVCSWFTPTVDSILETLDSIEETARRVTTVCLVGGFSANEYLYTQLKTRLSERGLTVFRPTNNAGHPSKAAADGALYFYTQCQVRKRRANFTIGTESVVCYKPNKRDHAARHKKLRKNLEGDFILPGYFEPLVSKGTVVTKNQEFRRSFFQCATIEEMSSLDNIEDDIEYYEGEGSAPSWVDECKGQFKKMCTVKAKTGQIPRRKMSGPNGTYWRIDYDIIFTFGPSEMYGQIAWDDRDGTEKRGKVNLVYLEEVASAGD